ncbi:MAG: hypothetical protein ACJAWI_003414 [Marinomonas primoryensis]
MCSADGNAGDVSYREHQCVISCLAISPMCGLDSSASYFFIVFIDSKPIDSKLIVLASYL